MDAWDRLRQPLLPEEKFVNSGAPMLAGKKKLQKLLAAAWQAGRESDSEVNPYASHVHRPQSVEGASYHHGLIYWCSCNRKIVRWKGHPGAWRVWR